MRSGFFEGDDYPGCLLVALRGLHIPLCWGWGVTKEVKRWVGEEGGN